MIVALLLPRLLDKTSDRPVMLTGAALLPVGLLGACALIAVPEGSATWPLLFGSWLFLGAATSLILTPSARLLRRASDDTNRPAVFSAQFSLSHACFIVTYPLAGVVGATLGLPVAAIVLAAIGAIAAVVAVASWRTVADVTRRSGAGARRAG
jgi:MFS family permease